MRLRDEYRANAQACLALSNKSSSQKVQAHWLAMAQYWLDLSENVAEEHQRTRDNDNEKSAPVDRKSSLLC